MNVAILGAGNVGSTLGLGLGRAGHQILYAVRRPEDPKHAALRASGASVVAVREAIEQADAVILATPWSATEDALAAAGDFAGKPLLDATNPIGPGFVLTHGHTDSGAEQVQRWASSAKVVKVFNTTGQGNMADSSYTGGPVAMFLCGDDSAACEVAQLMCADLGFEALNVGGLVRARLLEPAALLWIQLAQALGTRDVAFTLMRR